MAQSNGFIDQDDDLLELLEVGPDEAEILEEIRAAEALSAVSDTYGLLI